MFVFVFVMLCYALFCIYSSFLKRKRELFALLFLQMSCYCKCSVALPHGAMGWSAVCDYGFSGSYSLTFVG